MSGETEFDFMTLRTLNDLRQNERHKIAEAGNKIGAFVYYDGRPVITVPPGYLPDGQVTRVPSKSIVKWVTRQFRSHGWPLPDAIKERAGAACD